MFPSAKEAPTHETWVKEMSEGIKELEGEKEDEEVTEDDPKMDENEPESKEGQFKLKTRKQRRDAKKRHGQEYLARKLKEEQRIANDIFRYEIVEAFGFTV